MALTDTRPEAARVLDEIHRAMPPGKKWLLAGEAYRAGRLLHAAGVRLRNLEATPRQVLEDWIHRVLGFPHVPVSEPIMEPAPVNTGMAREVIHVLVRLGIPYALGGSLASSIHGAGRNTQDCDLTTPPFPDKVRAFVESFESPRYYISMQAIEDAHRERSCFNIIDSSTGLKADIFIRPDAGFEEVAMSRRRPVSLPDVPDDPIDVFTPEDIVLFKLRWYRLGEELSDRQWDDVKRVLRAQVGRLDEAYLNHWAEKLGVADLLARVRQESQP